MGEAFVWQPSPEVIERANITHFMRAVGVAHLQGLWDFARADIAGFYDRLVREIHLSWFKPYERVLDLSRGVPFARWFAGAEYNACYNCVDRHVESGRGAADAIVWEAEDGASRTLTFQELLAEVCKLANLLRACGVTKDDTVGIFMPLVPEAAIALLAIGRIGAIAVPAFSGYGAQALTTRLADARVKVLLTADGAYRRGKFVDMQAVVDPAVAGLPDLRQVISVRRAAGSMKSNGSTLDWTEGVRGQPESIKCERTGANDPYLLLYTSGSTGKPKGAVHGHAGFPVKVQIDQYLCFDVKPGDRMLWFTDMGWMMGPFLVLGALGLGATIVLYDGTPDYPKPDRLWEVCARHKVTHLGIAPTAIRSLMTHGEEEPRRHDLSSLRILGSTGEAWNPEPYKWFSSAVGGGKLPIINYSGGTEISGGILGCVPTEPLVPCAFHGPVPGMDADVVDGEGNSVRNEVGELVLRQPWPGMTLGFWHDDERYLQTYWSRLPGVWVHGDWASVSADGFWYIHGRSDDTINVAGKRVGPAEYESALVGHGAVREAAAIAVPDEIKGDAVVCLAVLRPGFEASDALRGELKKAVIASLGKALAAKAIRFVDDLPRTRNAKLMRRVARARYLKLENLGDLSALENPASLEAIDNAR
ncbi:MAG: AMP-dependent synthetase [Candidatus Eremiobacter antarcticus]|nr:MAG: AMP-dependent synthetase [Candidatus Eremiobacter sp. RRmetagenome_bin22]